MTNATLISLENHSDVRGSLYSYENVPFEIKRIFFLDVENTSISRGGHGHLKCWQLFIAVGAKIDVEVVFQAEKKNFEISVGQALLVPPLNHCTIHFNDQKSFLMVLASEKFDQEDYFY